LRLKSGGDGERAAPTNTVDPAHSHGKMHASNEPAKTMKNQKKPPSGRFTELEKTFKNRQEEP
jgi:hypothetical protein